MNIPKEVKHLFVCFGVESGVLGRVETSSPKRERCQAQACKKMSGAQTRGL
jgi:hypothetical protein